MVDLIIFQYNYLFLFAILFLFGMFYYFAKQIIHWGMDKGYYDLLGYMLGSLLFLHVLFIFLLLTDQAARMRELLPLFLQIMGVFGLLLLIGRGLHFVIKKAMKKA